MYPKEKADELFTKMAAKFPPQSETTFNVWNGARLCCLVAVDEIINAGADSKMIDGNILKVMSGEEYWNEVKREVENIYGAIATSAEGF